MKGYQKMKTINEKLTDGREYRNVYEIRAIEGTEENTEQMTVEGYATVFNEPYLLFEDRDIIVMEQVDAHAFDECDMTDVIMQYDHRGRVFARNKNNTLTVEPDERGLKVNADLGGTEIGRQLYQEIKGGYTDKMSFGFKVDGETREVTEEEGEKTVVLRTITSISKLYDVSAVSMPANDATVVSARSYCDGVIAERDAERQRAEDRRREVERIRLMMEV